MMTTSGFLSPAREGKLPEAKAPAPPPPPEVPPPVAPPLAEPPPVKKKIEKRKEKFGRELFKNDEKPVKKVPTMKDLVKMKQKSTAAAATGLPSATTVIPLSTQNVLSQLNEPKILPTQKAIEKIDKALAAAKAKTEKLNTTITPIPMKPQHPAMPPAVTLQQVEKLFNEPDKKKINIFKKISRDGKPKKDSRSAIPNLIIDETREIVNKINQLSGDITIEPIHPRHNNRPHERFDGYFDGGSPRPGTPLTGRMPDFLTHTSPMPQPKRRRQRDPNKKVKRQRKNQQFLETSDFVDIVMDRPKTPESLLTHLRQSQAQMGLPPLPPAHIPFPFLANFGGPGLIPPQLASPMFTFSQFGGLPNFGKNPYFPPLLNMPPSPQTEPVPLISPKVKETRDPPPEYKPAEIIPQIVRPPVPSQKPPPVLPQKPPPVLSQKPPPVPLQKPPSATPSPLPPRPLTPVITPSIPSASFPPTPPIQVPEASSSTTPTLPPSTVQSEEENKQKLKEHKKEKKDKIKKKNKRDKEKKEKSDKKKLKELKKDNKDKVKKEKKIKKKDKTPKEVVIENPIPKILLKVNSLSPRPETPETMKKLNIKPVVKPIEEPPIEQNINREPSPSGLAKISALVTGPPKPKANLSPAISPQIPAEKIVPEEPPVVVPKTPGRPRLNPPKPKAPPKPKKPEQTFKKIDDQGNEVWICPACGQQDDGRPMIGCDGCDAWYHWVCVGIQVPPDENENWYCKPCLCKKNEDFDKKKKRKRKEKKEH